MALDIYTSPCCSSWTCNVRYTAVFSLGVFALSILNCIVSSAHKSIKFSTSSVFQLVFPLTSVAILKLVSSMRCISEVCAQSSGKVQGARMSVYTTTKNELGYSASQRAMRVIQASHASHVSHGSEPCEPCEKIVKKKKSSKTTRLRSVYTEPIYTNDETV